MTPDGSSMEPAECVEARIGMGCSSRPLGLVGEWLALGMAEAVPRGVDVTLLVPPMWERPTTEPGLDRRRCEDSEAISSTAMVEEEAALALDKVEEAFFVDFGVLPSPIFDFDLPRLTVSRSGCEAY